MSTEDSTLELPLIAHLVELRDRLLRSVLVIFVVFLCMVAWANNIYEFVSLPLARPLPE
jgi:sec-independent protein translocase protein TatC